MSTLKEEALPLVDLGFLDITNEQLIRNHGAGEGVDVDVSSIANYLVTDSSIFKDTLKSIRKKSAFDQIRFEQESIYEACLNMSMNMAWVFPSEDGSILLDKCILAGIKGYDHARQHSFLGPHDEMARLRAFIMGASQHFHEMLFTNIYGKTLNGWRKWEPMSQPIYDWIAHNGYTEVRIIPNEERFSVAHYNIVRNHLMHSIFGFKDLAMAGIG